MLKKLVYLPFVSLFVVQTAFLEMSFAQKNLAEQAVVGMLDARRDLMSVYFDGDIALFKLSDPLEKISLGNYIKNTKSSAQSKVVENNVKQSSENNFSENELGSLPKKEREQIEDIITLVSSIFDFSKQEQDILILDNIVTAKKFSFASNAQYSNNTYLVVVKLFESKKSSELSGENISGQYMYFEQEDNNLNVINRRKAFADSEGEANLAMFYVNILSYFDMNAACYDVSLVKQTEDFYFFEAKLNSSICNFHYLYSSMSLIISRANSAIVKTVYYNKESVPQILVEAVSLKLVNDSVNWGARFVITDFSKNYKVYVESKDIYPFYNINQTKLNIKKEDFDKLSFISLY